MHDIKYNNNKYKFTKENTSEVFKIIINIKF